MKVKRYKVSNGLMILRSDVDWDKFNLQSIDVVLAEDYDALAAKLAALESARDASAIASATLRDESIAKDERIAKLERALNAIASADRSYPDKKIADDMQWRANTALGNL